MPYGAQIKLAIASQTAAGSGNAVALPANVGSFHHMAVISEDVGLTKAEIISMNLTGRFEQGAVYDGIAQVNGTLSFEATPKALGLVLSLIAPEGTNKVTSGTLETYTFFPRTADYSATIVGEPFTVYKQYSDSNSAECYFDCQFSKLTLTYAQGQLLKSQATVGGGTRMINGVGSAGITLDTQDLGLGILWSVASVSWGGGAVGNMSDITVSLDEKIAPVYTLNGTLAPYKYTRTGFREVTISGNMLFDSRSVFNDFVAASQRQLLIYSEARRTQVQSGYYASLLIDIPQLKFTQLKPGANGPGEISVAFNGRGIIDPNSNYTVRFVLANTWAAY